MAIQPSVDLGLSRCTKEKHFNRELKRYIYKTHVNMLKRIIFFDTLYCVYLVHSNCKVSKKNDTIQCIKKRLVFEIQNSHNYSDLIVLNCVELIEMIERNDTWQKRVLFTKEINWSCLISTKSFVLRPSNYTCQVNSIHYGYKDYAIIKLRGVTTKFKNTFFTACKLSKN